jgi:hypothetical protein
MLLVSILIIYLSSLDCSISSFFFTKKISLLFPYLSRLLHLKPSFTNKISLFFHFLSRLLNLKPFFTKKISLFLYFLSRLLKHKPFSCKTNILLSFFNSSIMRFLLFFLDIINYLRKIHRHMVLSPSCFLSLFWGLVANWPLQVYNH